MCASRIPFRFSFGCLVPYAHAFFIIKSVLHPKGRANVQTGTGTGNECETGCTHEWVSSCAHFEHNPTPPRTMDTDVPARILCLVWTCSHDCLCLSCALLVFVIFLSHLIYFLFSNFSKKLFVSIMISFKQRN